MQELIKTKVVQLQDCASAVRSGLLDVLSTPTVLAWMEEAAFELSLNLHSEDEVTVGLRVELDHLAPAFVGDCIQILARLREREGKKLFFDLEAKSGEKVLAEARHVRYIVKKNRFSKR